MKVPESQELKVNKEAASCKIFVTNITQAMTNEDLREHFETFGTVTDVYIPKPHRKFAFIRYVNNFTLNLVWIFYTGHQRTLMPKKCSLLDDKTSSFFLSFSESRVAQSLFGKDHVIKGTSCHIGQANPKSNSNQSGKTYRHDRGGGRDDDRRDYGGPRGFADYAGLATDNAFFLDMPFSCQRALTWYGGQTVDSSSRRTLFYFTAFEQLPHLSLVQ